MKLYSIALLPFSLCLGTFSSEPDYYWRDYNGIIPEDALIGWESGSEKLYIGNVHVRGEGVMIGHLKPGVEKIVVSGRADEPGIIHTRINFIQILCTRHKNNFKWIQTSASNLQNLNQGALIVGGHESQSHYPLYIGRVQYQGQTVISKVCPDIWFPWGSSEQKASSYEVLTYEEKFEETTTTATNQFYVTFTEDNRATTLESGKHNYCSNRTHGAFHIFLIILIIILEISVLILVIILVRLRRKCLVLSLNKILDDDSVLYTNITHN